MKMVRYVVCLAVLACCALVCTACFKVDKTYTITYYVDAYSAAAMVEVDRDAATMPYRPTLSHCDFNGYTTEPNGKGTLAVNANGEFLVQVRSNMTLYASWLGQMCYLQLDVADGTMEEDSTVEVLYFEALDSLPVPRKTGYHFVGWFDQTGRAQYTDGNGKMLQNMAQFDSYHYVIDAQNQCYLTAHYDVNQYAVRYDFTDAIDGEPHEVVKYVSYGTVLSNADFPVVGDYLDGVDIVGWVDAIYGTSCTDPVTSDMWLRPVFHYYHWVNFYDDFEHKETEVPEHMRVYSDATDFPYEPVAPKHYALDGWYASTTFAGNPLTVGQIYERNTTDVYARYIYQ